MFWGIEVVCWGRERLLAHTKQHLAACSVGLSHSGEIGIDMIYICFHWDQSCVTGFLAASHMEGSPA